MARRKIMPLDISDSPRYSQIATFARLPWEKDLTDVDVAFVGVPFDDGTTFRSGARMAPSSVREHSRLLRLYNPFVDVSPYEHFNVVDYGDISVIPGYIADTFERIEEGISVLASAHVAPLICGGDHSITYPVLRALAKTHGKINLLHFDSHFDFWDAYWGKKYTHGTWLRRAIEEGLTGKVSQGGIRGGFMSKEDSRYAQEQKITSFTIKAFHERGVEAVVAEMLSGIPKEEPLYVSVDIDFIDPAYAGATGTPEVGGVTSWQALECIRALAGHRLVGMDVVEVSPPYDGPGGITSLLAANLLFEGLSVMAKNHEQGLQIYR